MPKTAVLAPRKAPRKSLRASIDAFCRYCLYDPHSGLGNWRQQVTACTSPECPLYPVRPRSESEGT